jgi:hypothetical protein
MEGMIGENRRDELLRQVLVFKLQFDCVRDEIGFISTSMISRVLIK